MPQKQVTLYNSFYGMNVWKICFVLEELGLSFNDVEVDFNTKEQNSPAFLALNPNGKIPVLVDHQRNDFVIWESNAILQYLVDHYDKDHKISFPDSDEKHLMNQWLYFQASGQGPYYGQAQWFQKYHHEQLPSAIERYQNEIRRVLSVLDTVLTDKDWLVGNKPTIADLSLFKYNDYATQNLLGSDFDFVKEYPHAAGWHKRLSERPSVVAIYRYKEELRKVRVVSEPVW